MSTKANFLNISLLAIFIVGLGFITSCGDDETPSPQGPTAPILTSPADDATDQPLLPTLSWQASTASSAVEYSVFFDTNADPTTLLATGSTTSLTLSTPLQNSTTYYWKVQVTDANDLEATSEIFSFTTVAEEGFELTDSEFGVALEAQGLATLVNGSYILDQGATASVTNLDLGGAASAPLDIRDVSGIQFFTSLRELDIDYTSITNLDLSSNVNLDTLQYTNSSDNTGNFLTTMNLPTGMLRIRIFRHNLSSFDATPFAELQYLRLDGNDLPNAAVGGVTNVLSTLTVNETANPALVHLDMGGNLDADGNLITYEVSQVLFDQLTDGGANNKDGVVPPPTFDIVSIDPADDETNVAIDGIITVTFTSDLEASSLMFTLNDGSSDVAATASVNAEVLTITPDANLMNSTTYTLAISAADGTNGASIPAAQTITFTTVAADGYQIMDPEFGAVLVNQGLATESGGNFFLNEGAAALVTNLDLGGSSSSPINVQDIDGIQFFTALRELDIDYTSISSLDLSQNTNLDTLQYTNSSDNSANFLTSLTLPSGMLRIRVFRHNLADFDATGFTQLEYLRLDGNDLANAAVGGVTNALTTLTVDEASNPNLVHLDMGGNLDSEGNAITYQVSQALFDQLTSTSSGNKDGIVVAAAVQTDLQIQGLMSFQAGGSGGGGRDRAIHLRALADIPDLSIYGIGIANNGGGTDGREVDLPAISVSAGDDILFIRDEDETTITAYLGATCFGEFDHTFTDGVSEAINFNGDDAVELYSGTTIIEVYGDADVDGTGADWEYNGSWAFRDVNASDYTNADGATFAVGAVNCTLDAADNANSSCPYPFCVN